jgi:hypothetical protein
MGGWLPTPTAVAEMVQISAFAQIETKRWAAFVLQCARVVHHVE